MTVLRRSGMATAAMAAILVAGAAGQSAQAPGTTKAQASGMSAASSTATTPSKREIVVSLEDRKLALIEDGAVKKIYPVAVGKASTPSPVGTFTIARRVMNPTYAHDGKFVPPGPRNPVGSRWMGLSIRGYGIHGTNEPNSIGKAASHGCIRMAKADLEELYPQVAVGDTVELIGRRDEETAAIFGNPAVPASAQDSPQLASVHAPGAPAVHGAAAAADAANVSAEPSTNVSAVASALAVAGAL